MKNMNKTFGKFVSVNKIGKVTVKIDKTFTRLDAVQLARALDAAYDYSNQVSPTAF